MAMTCAEPCGPSILQKSRNPGCQAEQHQQPGWCWSSAKTPRAASGWESYQVLAGAEALVDPATATKALAAGHPSHSQNAAHAAQSPSTKSFARCNAATGSEKYRDLDKWKYLVIDLKSRHCQNSGNAFALHVLVPRFNIRRA